MDVFTTIHKHPLFMTSSCRIAFPLLAYVSLFQYSRSLKVLAFRRTLVHISVRYPCISSSWTQLVKNNNRPNYSQKIAWSNSHYSNYPWSFFVFMGNLIADDAVASLIYFFLFIHFFYKSKRYMCLCNVEKFSSFR